MQIRCKSICIQLYFFPHFRYEIWLHWFQLVAFTHVFRFFFQGFAGVPFFGLPGLLCTKFVCSSHRPACHSSCRPRGRPHPWLGEGETWHDATWDVGISWDSLRKPHNVWKENLILHFHTFFRGHFTSHQWVEFLIYCGFEIALQFCKATSVCTENAFLKEWDPRCPSTCPSHRLSLPERSPWLLPTETPLISKSVVYHDRSAQRVLIAKPLCGGWTLWSWNVPWWKTVEEDIEVNHLRYLRLIPRSKKKFFATTLQTGFYDKWWQTETGRQIWNTLTCSAGTQQRM